MIINGAGLLREAPIKDMFDRKIKEHGVSHGLAEVGYDLRLRQEVKFSVRYFLFGLICVRRVYVDGVKKRGNFTIASTMEEFDIPDSMMGIVHDKSTWARCGLSVYNTVLEPKWKGGLTLELVHNGPQDLLLPKGCGIAQVVFHRTLYSAEYKGKYQDQPVHPVEAIHE